MFPQALGYAIMITGRNAHEKQPQRESDSAMMNDIETIIIDYSQLMDLRIDFAFKTFADGNPEAMTSLLNAIFANAKIDRKSVV